LTLQRRWRARPSRQACRAWRSHAERLLGRYWVVSLLVLLPVVTICIAVVAAVALATMLAFVVLTRVIPQQLNPLVRRNLDGLAAG
jgi:hypothetical protein